jgi:hypothetical protein
MAPELPRRAPRSAALMGLVFLALTGALVPAGCGGVHHAGRGSPAEEVDGHTRATVEADWDDVRAALTLAAGKAEVAVESTTRTPTLFTAELRTIGSAPGRLTVSRAAGDGAGAGAEGGAEPRPELLTITCRIGRFRGEDDIRRERRLVGVMAARLRDLAGRDYAPLR